jgi:hypothetical protein
MGQIKIFSIEHWIKISILFFLRRQSIRNRLRGASDYQRKEKEKILMHSRLHRSTSEMTNLCDHT